MTNFQSLRVLPAALVLAGLVNAAQAVDLFIADPAAEAVYVVDSDALFEEPTLVSASGDTALGSGPAFSSICDIAISPTGRIFVLDGYAEPLRVIEIDRATGNRTTVLQLDQTGFLPHLEIRTEDRFVFARQPYPASAGSPGKKIQVIEYSANLDTTPVTITTREMTALGAPMDSALVDGRVHLLYPQVHGPWIIAEDSSPTAMIESPVTLISQIVGGLNFTAFSAVGERGYDAVFSGVPATGDRTVLILLEDPAGSSLRYLESRLTPPDAIQRSARMNTRVRTLETGTANTSIGRFPTTIPGQSAGDWTVRFMEANEGPMSTLPLRAAIHHMPSPRATQLANDTGAGVVTVFESFPPMIASFSTSDSTNLGRIAVTPPPSSGITNDMLSRASDFEVIGNSAFLALQEDTRLIRVDRSTGESVLLTPGRPSTLTTIGGFNPLSNIVFATRAPLSSSAQSTWSMY